MSLFANVVYHEERARTFGDQMVALAILMRAGDHCAQAFEYYRQKHLSHMAAWRALVLAASVEG